MLDFMATIENLYFDKKYSEKTEPGIKEQEVTERFYVLGNKEWLGNSDG